MKKNKHISDWIQDILKQDLEDVSPPDLDRMIQHAKKRSGLKEPLIFRDNKKMPLKKIFASLTLLLCLFLLYDHFYVNQVYTQKNQIEMDKEGYLRLINGVEVADEIEVYTLEEAQSLVPFPIILPKYLPEEYEAAPPVIRLLTSNGQARRVYITFPSNKETYLRYWIYHAPFSSLAEGHDDDLYKTQTENIAGKDYVMILNRENITSNQNDSLNWMCWNEEDNIHLLIAPISLDELSLIAQSIGYDGQDI